MTSNFSAGFQALGYLYQIRYALYLLITGSEDFRIAIELLDDISLSGNIEQLVQTKHHKSTSYISESSTDLWKTLRLWSTYIKEGQINSLDTVLTLVTTESISKESILEQLRPSYTNRNAEAIREHLVNIANNSSNKSLQKSYEAFLELSSDEQLTLISITRILDNSPNISDMSSEIKQELRYNTLNKDHANLLFERVEGWWLQKVISHLEKDSIEYITWDELHYKIVDLSFQFRPDSLPIDYSDYLPSSLDPDKDQSQFVIQLRSIAINSERIRKAIIDYYRAFEQRSRWVREDLLIGDELEKYERKLVDEWERYCLRQQDNTDLSKSNEDDLKKLGRNIYDWMEDKAAFRIRPNVSEEYIWRGSYHILADNIPPNVWWHPKFIEKLEELLSPD